MMRASPAGTRAGGGSGGSLRTAALSSIEVAPRNGRPPLAIS